MDKKKKIILICVCIVLMLVGIIICIDLFSKPDFNSLLINNDKNINENDIILDNEKNIEKDNSKKDTEENNKINSVNDNNKKDDNKKNNDVSDSNKKDDNDKNNDVNDNNNNKLEEKDGKDKYTENDVVSYFESIENEVESSSSFKEKFKKHFIDIVDFIFYDKEIKGYTFDELGNMTKIKIISIALKIDSKIEEYVPNYKENISSTSSKVYTNVKEKLVTMYLDISTDICSVDNEKECERVKEIFGEVKDACKIGWSFIKSLVSNGVTKLREWYEIYSGK